MDGSIYDFGLPRSAFQSAGAVVAHPPASTRFSSAVERREQRTTKLVGLITNPRSHRSGGASASAARLRNVISRAPATYAELRDTLELFVARGIDILAIAGGDGTVRDVLTCAGDLWGENWPEILLLPTGKTNALAVDLGVPEGWTLDQGLAAAATGRIATRAPLEIRSATGSGMTVRGFILGAGAFVDATALAQRTHRAGAFNGIAVGLALGWGIAQTLFGGSNSAWRAGSAISLSYSRDADRLHGTVPDGVDDRYLLLASTLQRLPLGLKPFGRLRGGLKTLVVDAPPRRLAVMLGPLLAGSESPGLERRGYHRVDAASLSVDLSSKFVLDGEVFPAGAYHVREALPLRFIVA